MNSSQNPRYTALSQIEPHEIEEAQKRFPGLRFIPSGRETRITGELSFSGRYNKNRHTYVFFDKTPDPYLIEDSFNIEITTGPGVNPYRKVRVTDEKFVAKAKELGVSPLRLHFHPLTKMVCINGYLDEDPNVGLLEFLVEKVAKSLYDITFFCKFSHWPTGEFAHGVTGVLENYFLLSQTKNSDKIELTKKCIQTLNQILVDGQDTEGVKHFKKALGCKKVKDSTKCPTCRTESGMMYRRVVDCHPNAFAGLKILKRILRQNPNLSTIT